VRPRSYPQDVALERLVLRACFHRNELLDTAAGLDKLDFTMERHSRVFDWLHERWMRGRRTSPAMLQSHISATGAKHFGSWEQLEALFDAPMELAHETTFKAGCGRLREIRQQREVRQEVDALHGRVAMDGFDEDPNLVANEAIEAFSNLSSTFDDSPMSAHLEVVRARVNRESIGDFVGRLDSGLPQWDDDADFCGLTREGMTLILAQSGVGKTSLLNCLGMGRARVGGLPYVHGTETTVKRRLRDMAFSLGGVDQRLWTHMSRLFRNGQLTDDTHMTVLFDDWGIKLRETMDWLGQSGLQATGAGLTVDAVCARARSLKRQGKCDSVFVDYLQDLTAVPSVGHNRMDQVNYASRRLKDLAAELEIPVVVAAQVSGEKNGPGADPKPQMWDTQWSSQVHQDSEEVLALYRDDLFRDRIKDWKPKGKSGCMEIIARKRRVGRLTTLELAFDGPAKWVGKRWSA
jgi:replicative DNA helicase